jgi:LAO/AO transport system kinase
MTRPDVSALVEGVRARHRASVSQAITLVESSKPEHRREARILLAGLEAGPDQPDAVRVGISGVPGVGKSTFIEALGSQLTAAGHRVGVLAVDPSSTRTGGSARASYSWPGWRVWVSASISSSWHAPATTPGCGRW